MQEFLYMAQHALMRSRSFKPVTGSMSKSRIVQWYEHKTQDFSWLVIPGILSFRVEPVGTRGLSD